MQIIDIVPAAVVAVGNEETVARPPGAAAEHAARKTKNVAKLTKPERDQSGGRQLVGWCAGLRLSFLLYSPRNVLVIVLAV